MRTPRPIPTPDARAARSAQMRGGVGAGRKSDDGDTALHCAAANGSAGELRLLLGSGADPDAHGFEGGTPLHWAASFGGAWVLGLLLAGGADPSRKNKSGDTALHCAPRSGDIAGLKLLLAAGADPNSVNIVGDTPLHAAAEYRNSPRQLSQGVGFAAGRWRRVEQPRDIEGLKRLVGALLSGGADPNGKVTASGQTPLHAAVGRGNTEAVELLLQHGAHIHIRNNLGCSALDYARTMRYPDIIALLQTAAPRNQKAPQLTRRTKNE